MYKEKIITITSYRPDIGFRRQSLKPSQKSPKHHGIKVIVGLLKDGMKEDAEGKTIKIYKKISDNNGSKGLKKIQFL